MKSIKLLLAISAAIISLFSYVIGYNTAYNKGYSAAINYAMECAQRYKICPPSNP